MSSGIIQAIDSKNDISIFKWLLRWFEWYIGRKINVGDICPSQTACYHDKKSIEVNRNFEMKPNISPQVLPSTIPSVASDCFISSIAEAQSFSLFLRK